MPTIPKPCYGIGFSGYGTPGDCEAILNMLRKRYDVIRNDETPDFLFVGPFGIEYLNYDCTKIYISGENTIPDFNLVDYGIAYDHIDYGDRYLRVPYYLHVVKKEHRDRPGREYFVRELANKKGFCSFLYSNSQFADPIREDFFDKLSAYRSVDSGGKNRNNIGRVVPQSETLEWLKGYKFAIAFENSSKPGYVTEKLYQALMADCIPVYWGAPDVCRDFNVKRFVNCADYNSLDDVVERVRELDEDSEKYLDMVSQPWFADEAVPLADEYPLFRDFIYHILDQGPQASRRVVKYGYNSINLWYYRQFYKFCGEKGSFRRKGPLKWSWRLLRQFFKERFGGKAKR